MKNKAFWLILSSIFIPLKIFSFEQNISTSELFLNARFLVDSSFNLSVQERLNKLTEAEQICQKILQIEPEDPNTLALLGEIYLRLNILDKAEQNLIKSLNLNPRNTISHRTLAICYILKGNLDLASARLEEMIKLNPQYADGFFIVGFIQAFQKDYRKVKRHLQQFLSERKNSASAHILAGKVYEFAGYPLDAKSEYLSAINLDRENAEAKYRLGWLYYREGKKEEAIEQWTAVQHNLVDAKESLVFAYCQQGWDFYNKNDRYNARLSYMKALSLEADNPEAQFMLSLIGN